MKRHVDYETVARLLDDESLSLNEIARLAGCSSWSVRKFSRELDGDERPMKRPRASARAPSDDTTTSDSNGLSGCGWLILGGIVLAVIALSMIGPKNDPGDWA
jgi:hypothetical protein